VEWFSVYKHFYKIFKRAHLAQWMVTAAAWDALSKEIEQSPCGALYGTNCVIGRGSLTPRIVFIGEAPGAEEDRLKQPFVGRSGKMLEEWIAYCGLPADSYYITNVVKTRPPENRDPTPQEVALCAPWLQKQLDLLQPQVIVCVGRFAMNYVYPKKKSILSESGKLHDGKYYIVPHPSFFLRRGGTGWEPYLKELKQLMQQRTL
jgi:uracil-DNA glycosylase